MTITISGSGTMGTMSSGGITGGATLNAAAAQSTTSGTSVTFTGIPSWVKKITIQNNGVTSSGAAPLIQIGSWSYVTSGYNAGYGSINTTPVAAFSGTTTGILFGGSAASYGAIIFTLQNSSTNTWVASGTIVTPSNFIFYIAGQVTLSGNLDRIQITLSTGAFTGGSVNILYEG